MSQHEAEESAVRRFGSAGTLAHPFDQYSILLKLLLAFATTATVLVAMWLFFVIARVLPARDPSHIPMWRMVALGILLYSGLCLTYLVAGPHQPALRWSVLVLSVVAIALGVYAIVQMIHVANTGGHFEGYLVLMGLILSGHGTTAILYTIFTEGIARRLRGR